MDCIGAGGYVECTSDDEMRGVQCSRMQTGCVPQAAIAAITTLAVFDSLDVVQITFYVPSERRHTYPPIAIHHGQPLLIDGE